MRRQRRPARRERRSQPPTRDSRRYAPDPLALPRFHMWTLGCQMNRSDSEEMAGRLLAAGCEEADSFETADLVVINTCAIREGAEQKVIGRQGHLARLKAAKPAMRVVLTGCSVREPDRAGLTKRYPAVDLFLRPDEEPELVDRLGLASAQGAIASMRPGGAVGATTTVGRAVVGVAEGWSTPAPGPSGRGPSRATRRSAPGCRSSTAATRPVPTASCRSVADPSAAGRSTRSSTKPGTWPHRATARSRCSARTSIPRARPAGRGPLCARRRRTWAGRQLDLHGRPDLAELIRAIDGAPHGRRPPGDPQAAVRHLAPVGPLGSIDRGDGRVPERLRAPAPAGPVG